MADWRHRSAAGVPMPAEAVVGARWRGDDYGIRVLLYGSRPSSMQRGWPICRAAVFGR